MRTTPMMILLTVAGCAPEAVSPPCWSYCEPITLYEDEDGDGYGSAPYVGYERPPGYVDLGGDCDDADAGTYPGAPEVCDGIDNDCDGDASDAGLATFFPRDGGAPEPVSLGTGSVLELDRSGRLLLCSRERTGGVLVTAPDVELRGMRGAALTVLGGLSGDRSVVPGGGPAPGSVVTVQAPGSAYVTGLTIRGGRSETGGGVYCAGEGALLMLEDVVVIENEALLDGGGVAAVDGCVLEAYGVQVLDNVAGRSGGGFHLSGVPVDDEHVVDRVTMRNNTAGSNGGGLHAVASRVTGYSTLEASGNEAGFAGGGLYVEWSMLNGSQVKLAENTATYGGGMMVNSATFCAAELGVVRNEGLGSGGGMILAGSSLANVTRLLVGENRGELGSGAWVGDEATLAWATNSNWYDDAYHGGASWDLSSTGGGSCLSGSCGSLKVVSASCAR